MAVDDAVKLLDTAALNGEIDNVKWSELLDSVVLRLDNIVQTTFPIPTVSPSPKFTQLMPDSSSVEVIPSSQQTVSASDKVNSLPTDDQQLSQSVTKLPAALQAFYEGIKSNLVNTFAAKPPYTIQRLAELLLVPTEHYRTLPAFLRAVDRVVSVSSTADVFPLPYTALDSNGAFGSSPDDFNGAALSRIPWLKDEKQEWLRDSADMLGIDDRVTGTNTDLRTESTALIDGPNGAGSIETVTVAVNGVGRLSSQPATHQDTATGNHVKEGLEIPIESREGIAAEDNPTEEVPFARGPEEIGIQDMGPQKTFQATEGPADSIQAAERAVGRPGEGQRISTEADDTEEKADTDPMSLTEEDEKIDDTTAES